MSSQASTRSRSLLRTTICIAVALILLGPASTAEAGGDWGPPPGPSARLTDTGGRATAVDVVLDGDGVKGSPGRRRATIPATCWWQTALGPADDPDAMLAAFEDGTLHTLTKEAFLGVSWMITLTKWSAVATSRDQFEAATDEPDGTVRWYMAVCRDGATYSDYETFLGLCPVGIVYAAFPTGRPPAPRVDPQDLAVYANRNLDLPAPRVDHNPKLTGTGTGTGGAALAGATVVGLPTWFWVTDPAAAGGPDRTRTVRATAGDVWAQVDATFEHLTITSPAGDTTCTPDQARTPYRDGTPENAACTLAFTRASVAHPGGWPVTVTATWHLTWHGTNGAGADLGTQPHTWTTTIPVAEVQALTTLN